MLDIAAALPCNVAVSSYANAMYDDALKGWARHTWQAMTRGGLRTEVLWVKPAPRAFNPRAYVGRDFRDRLRVRRKAQRWAEMFGRMPDYEKDAVLAALLEQRRA